MAHGAMGSGAPMVMPMASSGTGGSGAAAAAAGTIEIEAFDLGFKPATVSVTAAGTYDVTFHNTGSMTHDLTFADGTKLVAESGKTATGQVTIPAAGLTFLCSIPGHEAAWHGRLRHGRCRLAAGLGGPAAPPAGSAAAAPVADPNAPPYVLRDAAAPRVLAGHRPRRPDADRRQGHHGRRGLRRPCLDVRRDRPRVRRFASTSATPCGST